MAELTAKEQLAQMINGTYVDEVDESVDGATKTEDDVENYDTTDTDEVETDGNNDSQDNSEDTDQETEADEEEETEEENDDSAKETSDTDDEGQEEDAHNEAEESTNKSENAVAEPNYKEFYEKVALAKFTANGKEVEGFKDPEDLIRAQQMLHGYSDKMKVFKEYRPFLKALEERKITGDSDRFNLAMSLLDGDPEAIKKVLKEKNIDPLELDLEDIKYIPKNMLPSNAQMLIEESYEQAENMGIVDKFNRVISKDWDVQSLQEFVSNGAVRNDLMQHLKDGTYEVVQNEIKRMELLDSTGVLDGMTSVEKYRTAMRRLQQQQQASKAKPIAETPTVDKAVIAAKAKEEAEFKRKAAEREQKADEERRKAASVSKKKVPSKPKPAPKLEELKGDEFRNAFKNMLMG